jgi:hypothetical protein
MEYKTNDMRLPPDFSPSKVNKIIDRICFEQIQLISILKHTWEGNVGIH